MLSNFLIAEVLPSDSINLLASTAIFFLCALLSLPLVKAVKQLLVSRVSGKTNTATSAALYMRLLNLPLSFFRQHNSGELSSRMRMFSDTCSVVTSAVLDDALTAAFSLAYVVQSSASRPRWWCRPW